MFCFWAEIRISKQSQTILKNVQYDLKIFFLNYIKNWNAQNYIKNQSLNNEHLNDRTYPIVELWEYFARIPRYFKHKTYYVAIQVWCMIF